MEAIRSRHVTAIRVIFDGKAFVPRQPVSLPAPSDALVIVEKSDRSAQDQLDAAVRAYYQGVAAATQTMMRGGRRPRRRSHRAWDED